MNLVNRLLIANLPIAFFALIFAWYHFQQQPLAVDILPDEQLSVGGEIRHFRITLPRNRLPNGPLLIAFHGIGDSPDSMASYARLDSLAADKGFILCVPAAIKTIWSTHDISSSKLDSNPDVLFFDKLVQYLRTEYEVDPNRIYVIGMSNGATFAQIVGTIRSTSIAAIVAHSGPRPPTLELSPRHPPILLVCGSRDPNLSQIQQDYNRYIDAGTKVKSKIVEGLGHEWSTGDNKAMCDFLANQTQSNSP